MYQIREMVDTDWKSVSEIYQEGMDTNNATFQTECPEYEQWKQAHHKSCRLVAIERDKVIGFAVIAGISNRCVYAGVAEVSVYITQKYHGQGIGKDLLNALIIMSEENGIWTLQSQIFENNLASLRLHENCGFCKVGLREKIGRDRYGTWRTIILMERRSQLEKYN